MAVAKPVGIPTPIVDLAFTFIFVMVAIFLFSTMDKPKKAEDGKVVPKAEFMITMDWDDNSRNDIDLHVKGPDGKVVYFGQNRTPLMFLDVDNLGYDQTIQMPDGSILQQPSRREVVTIRQIVPGTYTVNAHYYRHRGEPQANHVKVQIIKLNPYKVVYQGEQVFDQEAQEHTFTNLTIDASGAVVETYDAQVGLVSQGRGEQR